MAGHGWPLAYLWDYGQQKIRNCQVNLASEWGWGRNVRVTSWVAFCVLGMSNSCRRTRKGYKQTGLCVFSSEGMALENEGGIWLLLCTLLSWFFFFFCQGHSCVLPHECHMNAKGIQSLKNLCSDWGILCRIRGWFLLLLLFVFSLFFPTDLENIYDTKCS